MDDRRRRLRGRDTPSAGVDVQVFAPVERSEGDRPRPDSGSGSALNDDRSTGFGQHARDDEGAMTRATPVDSPHATRGE